VSQPHQWSSDEPTSDDAADLELAEEDLVALLDLLAGTDVEEAEIEWAGARLYVRRRHGLAPVAATAPIQPPRQESEPITVVAPQVGIFRYPTDQDGAGPLVSEGMEVRAGQLIGLIEVLRLPNRIEAPVAGVIERIHVPDGAPVEYGQPLFVLRPRSD